MSRPVDEPTATAPPTVLSTREQTAATTVDVEPEAEPEPQAEPVTRPSFRERMARTATAMAGAFGGVRARGGITVDTWEDLEEALLKADVGSESPTHCSMVCDRA